MKKIKFRALALEDTGGKKCNPPKLVYGNVRITEKGDYAHITTFKNKRGETFTYLVDPESIAQFVGYDEDGKEVYVGDELVDGWGNVYYAYGTMGIDESPIGLQFDNCHAKGYKLKESGKNDC